MSKRLLIMTILMLTSFVGIVIMPLALGYSLWTYIIWSMLGVIFEINLTLFAVEMAGDRNDI